MSPALALPLTVSQGADGRCGYQDARGEPVVPAAFAECERGPWPLTWVPVRAEAGGAWDLYDVEAGRALGLRLDASPWGAITADLAAGQVGGRAVLVRRDGTLVPLGRSTRQVSLLEYSLPLVEDTRGWRWVRPDGASLLRQRASFATPFGMGRAFGVFGGEVWLVDTSGVLLVQLGSAHEVTLVEDGRAADGQITSAPFADGWALISIQGQLQAIDRCGARVPAQALTDLGEGRGGFQAPEGCWGLLATEGGVLVQPAYAELTPYSQGLAAVVTPSGAWLYLDRTGAPVLPGPYAWAEGSWWIWPWSAG